MISLELFFNDTLLCYHRKIKQMILGRNCSYLSSVVVNKLVVEFEN
jgi:hypothetical protein